MSGTSKRRLTVSTIPRGGEINDDTEFVFVGGQAFVNAKKHQEVVDYHLHRAVEAIREVVAEGFDSERRRVAEKWLADLSPATLEPVLHGAGVPGGETGAAASSPLIQTTPDRSFGGRGATDG